MRFILCSFEFITQPASVTADGSVVWLAFLTEGILEAIMAGFKSWTKYDTQLFWVFFQYVETVCYLLSSLLSYMTGPQMYVWFTSQALCWLHSQLAMWKWKYGLQQWKKKKRLFLHNLWSWSSELCLKRWLRIYVQERGKTLLRF